MLGLILVAACVRQEPFPNHIPQIKATLGRMTRALEARAPDILDSACTDRELYASLLDVLGPDHLAVLGRQIRNPIDSAHVTLTIAPRRADGSIAPERYELELFMRRRNEVYWILAHRLTRSP